MRTSIRPGIPLLTLCALLAVAGAAPAPQGQPAPAPQQRPAPPESPQTEAANTASDFGGDAVLSKLVGTWRVEGTAIAPDGSKTTGFGGTCRFGPAMGGTFLGGDHLITRGESALQIQDMMGFAAPGGFSRSEVTTGDRALFMSTGRWQADSQTLSFTTVNPLVTPDGKPRSLVSLFRFEQGGTVTWTTAFLTDGQPAGTVVLTLTRESDTPGVSAPDTPFGAPVMAGGAQMPQGAGGNGFIVQGPTGMAVTRAPQSVAETQQVLQAMIKQKQQMQAQVSTMQQQVQDMSRNFHEAMQP